MLNSQLSVRYVLSPVRIEQKMAEICISIKVFMMTLIEDKLLEKIRVVCVWRSEVMNRSSRAGQFKRGRQLMNVLLLY